MEGRVRRRAGGVREGLEKYLTTKLYPNIFAVVNEERTLDDVLGRRIAALRTFIRPEHLDIPECFRVEASLALARNELVKVNNFKAPRDKLVCVLNTCRVINNLLERIRREPTRGCRRLPPCAHLRRDAGQPAAAGVQPEVHSEVQA